MGTTALAGRRRMAAVPTSSATARRRWRRLVRFTAAWRRSGRGTARRRGRVPTERRRATTSRLRGRARRLIRAGLRGGGTCGASERNQHNQRLEIHHLSRETLARKPGGIARRATARPTPAPPISSYPWSIKSKSLFRAIKNGAQRLQHRRGELPRNRFWL